MSSSPLPSPLAEDFAPIDEDAFEVIDANVEDKVNSKATDPTRTVTLSKGDDGKFGIVRRTNRIIDADGPAKLGGMMEGDEIISINGANVEKCVHGEIRELLREANGPTTFVLRSKPRTVVDLDGFWKVLKAQCEDKDFHSKIDLVRSLMGIRNFILNSSLGLIFIGFLTLLMSDSKVLCFCAGGMNVLATLVAALTMPRKEDFQGLLSALKWFKSVFPEVSASPTVTSEEASGAPTVASTAAPTESIVDADQTETIQATEKKMHVRTVTLNTGEHGQFGIHYTKNLITGVITGSPAHFAEIQKGHEMIRIDGVKVDDALDGNAESLCEKASKNGQITLELRFNPYRLKKEEDEETMCCIKKNEKTEKQKNKYFLITGALLALAWCAFFFCVKWLGKN